MKALKPKSFKPANIGLTSPKMESFAQRTSDSPAAISTRRAGRAGVVGRKLRVKATSGKY